MSNPKLYYTNAGGDHNWDTLSNWNTAANGSGSIATNVPWTDDGNGGAWYGDYDLVNTPSGGQINIGSAISEHAIGSCDISSVTNFNNGAINGGTFTGDYFSNYNSISGGTFSGGGFYNGGDIGGGTFTGGGFYNGGGTISGGTFTGNGFNNDIYSHIYGGTFTGNGFNNEGGGMIFGGTFTGDGFYNNGYILGGTFSGDNFYNDNGISGGTFTGYNFYNDNGEIYGGTFEIIGFINIFGTITYQSISITSGGNPYTGVWDGQNWDCTGNWFSPSNEDGQTHTDPNDTMCRNSSVDTLGYCCGDSVPFWRFDNLSNDAKWTTLKNWNFNKNSSTWHPSVPPWTSATTAGTSLYMAPGNSQPPVLNGLILGENTDGTFFLISGRTDPFITNQVLINSLSIINSIIL